MRKKAQEKKEQETDFEEKRLNLSLEEERELNKENERIKYTKDPYYDQQAYVLHYIYFKILIWKMIWLNFFLFKTSIELFRIVMQSFNCIVSHDAILNDMFHEILYKIFDNCDSKAWLR